jgi:hypothetical protein
MRLFLLLLVACGSNARTPQRPAPVAQAPSCREIIAPMVQRQVSATVNDIAEREHLDVDQHAQLAVLAHARAVELAAAMVRSCVDDQWSAAARSCYGSATTPDQFRDCDRLLTLDQKQRVIARAGI